MLQELAVPPGLTRRRPEAFTTQPSERPMKSLSTSLAALVFLAGCTGSATEPADEAVAVSSAAIIGGSPSSARDSVVLLVSNNGFGQSICTGTLVAPNLVLTARHCVSAVSDGRFLCNEQGEPTTTYAGGRYLRDGVPSLIGVFTGAQAPERATGFNDPSAYGAEILHDGSTHLCSGDLALLLLDRAVTSAQISPVRFDRFPAVDDHVTVVGFGVTNDNREASSRIERGGVSVLRVGPEPGSTSAAAVSRSMFEVGEATCSGDSGGPAFDERTGAVVGVVSAGGNGTSGNPQDRAGRCRGDTTRNYFTATGAFGSVLRDAFSRSGFRPWLEGTPAPTRREVGASCDTNDACASGACIDGGDGSQVCSSPCDRRSAGCPARWTCESTSASSLGSCRPPALEPNNAPTDSADAGACAVSPTTRAPSTSSIVALGIAALGLWRRSRRSRQPT